MKKNLRINAICHFLLLEDENIARFLILTIIQCLEYPDAYTCRRCIKICHRILETVAWVEQYTELLGQHMLFAAVKSIITEPKWMVGLEWEMINLVRDIYCRLVLGQSLLFGGQGVAMEHSKNNLGTQFEQAKTVEKPLQGGGILCKPSDYPRNTFASLPGIRPDAVLEMEQALKSKLAAKDQKDILRNFLRDAACILKEKELESGSDRFMRRATESESMLNQNMRHANVVDIPEKLVTHKMLIKQETQENSQDIISPACLFTIT
jgi:exportin-5